MTTDRKGNLYVGGPDGLLVLAPLRLPHLSIPMKTARVAGLALEARIL
jgi:hypothetical protein